MKSRSKASKDESDDDSPTKKSEAIVKLNNVFEDIDANDRFYA